MTKRLHKINFISKIMELKFNKCQQLIFNDLDLYYQNSSCNQIRF